MLLKPVFFIGLITLASILWDLYHLPEPATFMVKDNSSPNHPQLASEPSPLFKSDFASQSSSKEVHSASAIELADNHIMAFWYGGKREGHKNVAIYKNIWNSTIQQWGKESAFITRASTQKGTFRYIRKLGNPVVTRMADNSIWLFYVTVSIGGWAGSSINLVKSTDEGQT